jgi:membrane-bound metal-dependent hydrolase YbcI (DUF457 family)
MYPLGHMALGYFAARIIHRETLSGYNLLWLWAISFSPDIDIVIPFLTHRGPTHSLVVIMVFAIPIILLRREWLPYVASLGSHALIGDFITGSTYMPGCMLFWPFSPSFFNIGSYLRMGSLFELGLELVLFAIMILMLRSSGELEIV